MTGTVQIVVDGDDFSNCPLCGQDVFRAELMANGEVQFVIVCQACEVAWPVQEDD